MDALPMEEKTDLPYASKVITKNFDGNDVYMFFTLSTDRPGYSCVSLMTPFKLEILSTDFNLNEVKVSEWNNIPGSPKI